MKAQPFGKNVVMERVFSIILHIKMIIYTKIHRTHQRYTYIDGTSTHIVVFISSGNLVKHRCQYVHI